MMATSRQNDSPVRPLRGTRARMNRDDVPDPGRPDVTIVIPVFNEEESLSELLRQLDAALAPLEVETEIIFVDDGSGDGSLAVLRQLAARDERVKVIVFRRNFGQTAALDAGFRHARGDVIVAMDADLQNDPADIPRLLDKIAEGYDVVSGWRKKRREPFFTRVLPSRMANWLISRITGIRLHDFGCTLTAYRREIMSDVHLFGEMHRFIPVWANWAGGRITEIEVSHHPRRFGSTKYSLFRTFRVVLDLITVHFLVAYTSKPAYFFGKFGLAAFLLSFLTLCWTLVERQLFGTWVHKNPVFLIGIFSALVGVQVIFTGLLAELNTRTHFAASGRPAYFVRECINLDEADGMVGRPGADREG